MTLSHAKACGFTLSIILGLGAAVAQAADLPPPAAPVPPVMTSSWTYRFTPYGWLISLNGNQTVKRRTAKVDASFIDIVDASLGDGGTLSALMADIEARNGRFSLLGNFAGLKVSVDRGGVRTRSATPDIVGAIGASGDAKTSMAILEAGATYEVACSGSVAFDILAGARYWNQRADLSFDAGATVDVGDLSFGRNAAIACSGSVDWIDGFAGARMRIGLAPGRRSEAAS